MHTPHTTLNTGITCLFILIYICIYSFAITLSIDNTCVYLSLALSPSLSLYIYIYIYIVIYIYIYIYTYKHTTDTQFPFPPSILSFSLRGEHSLPRAGAHTRGGSYDWFILAWTLGNIKWQSARSARVPISGPSYHTRTYTSCGVCFCCIACAHVYDRLSPYSTSAVRV